MSVAGNFIFGILAHACCIYIHMHTCMRKAARPHMMRSLPNTNIGKWRLAQLVMYVPLPVVGGYLGYVGYFCVAGGAALAAGVEVGVLPFPQHAHSHCVQKRCMHISAGSRTRGRSMAGLHAMNAAVARTGSPPPGHGEERGGGKHGGVSPHHNDGSSLVHGVITPHAFQINTVLSWAHVLNGPCLLKLLPLAVTVVILMLTMEHCSHPMALPGVLVIIPVLVSAWGASRAA